MKRCGKCGSENADQMQFCLQCGNKLPDAPIVINLQNDTSPHQSAVKTENYGQSVATQVGRNQYTSPDFPTANAPRRNNTKIFLAVGGVLALLLLGIIAVAAIVVYNMLPGEKAAYTPTPTPISNRKIETDSPTPKSTATPETSPTKTSKTPTTLEDSPDVTVKFDGVDVNYNVKEKSRTGMRMMTSFTVTGMKDVDSYLAIHFQKRDGTPLSTNSSEFRDVNGNLAVFKTLKPDYEETEYKDLTLFIPYDEIGLPIGRHELRMDIDLLDGKGATVEHLAFENFWYEQK